MNGDLLEADFWTILAAGFERHSFKFLPFGGTHRLGMPVVAGASIHVRERVMSVTDGAA
jgi:hypothetical protein